MERYTQRREETWALAEGAELSRALDRLGRCEDLLSDLEREQTELSQKLEECKAQLEAALAAAGEAKETPSGNICFKR